MRKLIAFISIVFLLIPNLAFAQISTDSTGLTTTGDKIYGSNYLTQEENQDIGSYIGAKIITPLFSLLGVIFLLLMIYSGILWMTSGGVTEQVTKAKHILVNSTIGLIIIILAYAITKFVFQILA